MARTNKDPFENSVCYHIYNKVVSEVTLFKKDRDYVDFLRRYEKYLSGYFDTYAYCLMPNHFHFLIRVKDDVDSIVTLENTNASKKHMEGKVSLNAVLENQLSRMFSGVLLRYNKAYNRVGPLFKEGTKRVALLTEARIVYQLCYIHHNPIHHHLAGNYDQWVYSSYQAYIGSKETKIAKSKILNWLGGIDVFLQLHDEFKLTKKENLFYENYLKDH